MGVVGRSGESDGKERQGEVGSAEAVEEAVGGKCHGNGKAGREFEREELLRGFEGGFMIELTKVTYDQMVATGKIEVDEDGKPSMEGPGEDRIPVRVIDAHGVSPDMTVDERLDRVLQRAVTAMKKTMFDSLGSGVKLSFVVVGELEEFRRECSWNPEAVKAVFQPKTKSRKKAAA